MEQAEPNARLFATLVGAGLVIYGIVGFFYDSSFAAPEDVRDALGLFSVNGWANVFHILTGAAGLLVAGFASRRYAIGISFAYLLIAIAGSLGIGTIPVAGRNVLYFSRPTIVGSHRRDSKKLSGTPTGTVPTGRRGRRAERRRPFACWRPRRRTSSRTQGAGGDPAGADGDHRPHPVARVAQRPQLALGELLGPVGELLGGGLGDGGEGVLEAAREPLRRLDRPQRVAEQAARRPRCCRSAARSPHSSLISS